MDLDLNQEPFDPSHGLDSLLNELETAHGRIEERIRQLEAVTYRSLQRQRWRQTIPQTVTNAVEPASSEVQSDDRLVTERVGAATQARTFEARKRNGTHLIAKALGTDTDAKMTRSDKGGFFDCNICLGIARDPILTRCGHLFCWPCFYQLSYVHLNVKECPVCMEEVTDTSIIPIYGNGNDNNSQKSMFKESGFKVPPRPHAQRIESVRQQLINRRAISSAIDPNMWLFNMTVGVEERSESQDLDGTPFMTERAGFLANPSHTSQLPPATQTQGNQHHHPSQVSRLLLQGAASFSSLSSALNSAVDSAERLIEDITASIHSRILQRNHQHSSSVDDRDSFSSISVAIQGDSQILDNVADTDSTLAHPASSFRTINTGSVMQLENQRRDTPIDGNNMPSISSSSSRRRTEVDNSIEVNSTASHSSSSSRRRIEFPRLSDADSGPYRQSRRRRLM